MTIRAPLLAAGLTLLLSQFSSAQEATTYVLRYQFVAGSVLRYQESLRGDYKVQLQDNLEDTYSEQQSTKSLHVESLLENGNAVVVPVIDVIDSLVTFDQGTKHVFQQAATPDEPLVFAALRELQGKRRVKLTVSPIGQVMDVAPATSALKEVEVDGEIVDKLDAATAHSLAVLPRLPTDPVAVKGTWKYFYEVNVPVTDSDTLKKPFKMMQSFTLESVANGRAIITYHTSVLSPVTDPAVAVQFLQRKPRGTFELDIERGVMLAHRVAQEETVVGYAGAATSINLKQDRSETLIPAQAASSPAIIR